MRKALATSVALLLSALPFISVAEAQNAPVPNSAQPPATTAPPPVVAPEADRLLKEASAYLVVVKPA